MGWIYSNNSLFAISISYGLGSASLPCTRISLTSIAIMAGKHRFPAAVALCPTGKQLTVLLFDYSKFRNFLQTFKFTGIGYLNGAVLVEKYMVDF